MMHDFELHEFFHSLKNVHFKALLYSGAVKKVIQMYKKFINFQLLEPAQISDYVS